MKSIMLLLKGEETSLFSYHVAGWLKFLEWSLLHPPGSVSVQEVIIWPWTITFLLKMAKKSKVMIKLKLNDDYLMEKTTESWISFDLGSLLWQVWLPCFDFDKQKIDSFFFLSVSFPISFLWAWWIWHSIQLFWDSFYLLLQFLAQLLN